MHNLQWQLRQVGKLRQLIAQIPSRDSNNNYKIPKKTTSCMLDYADFK